MTQRFSFSPSTPARGSQYKVCYDFTGLPDSVTSVTANGTNSPSDPNDPMVCVFDRADANPDGIVCCTVTAPSGADAAVWVDTSGNSQPAGVTFSDS